MSGSGSQKDIGKDRPPRVQIEFEQLTYGSAKKVSLPFVMGVMADLSGKPAEALPAVEDRKFVEFNAENLDARMKAMKPRVAFAVPNALTGEGNLAVDITFASLDDFSPAAIAAKVEPLAKLLQARTELKNLLSYVDGKAGAEQLLQQLLSNPELRQSLAAAPKGTDADPASDA